MSIPGGETLSQSQAQTGLATGGTLLATGAPGIMSRSTTMRSDDSHDATRTLTDLHAHDKLSPKSVNGDLPSESTLGKVEKQLEAEGKGPHEPHLNALASLPPAKKSVLLFCFCLAMVCPPSHQRLYGRKTDQTLIVVHRCCRCFGHFPHDPCESNQSYQRTPLTLANLGRPRC